MPGSHPVGRQRLQDNKESMGSIDLSKAKSRWSTEQAATGESAITGDADSPFAVMDDGLTDLRGLVVKKILKNARVSSVDLSGAVFEGFAQFSACHVESTRFRSAFLNTNVGRSFRSCDFSSANMIRAVLRGEFVACDFTRLAQWALKSVLSDVYLSKRTSINRICFTPPSKIASFRTANIRMDLSRVQNSFGALWDMKISETQSWTKAVRCSLDGQSQQVEVDFDS